MFTAQAPVGQWALGMQLAIVVAIAAFFGVLTRSYRLSEVRLWAVGWAVNALALLAMLLRPAARGLPLLSVLLTLVYMCGKTSFALLMVGGARHHLRPSSVFPLRPLQLGVIVGAWGLAFSAVAPLLRGVAPAQSAMVGGIFVYGAVWVVRNPRFARSAWLGWAFLVEGLLFLHYAVVLTPAIVGGRPLLPWVGYASFLDGVAELLVALSALVAIEGSSAQQLRQVNQELLQSRDRLRRMVDVDPLTFLGNRSALQRDTPELGRSGGAVVFLDLDDFKEINDRHGHATGDTCLRRVARLTQEVFRSGDQTYRWGGDEFLVIAPGLGLTAAHERADQLVAQLAAPCADCPGVQVAVGISVLEPGGDVNAAIDEADRRMYANKREGKRR